MCFFSFQFPHLKKRMKVNPYFWIFIFYISKIVNILCYKAVNQCSFISN